MSMNREALSRGSRREPGVVTLVAPERVQPGESLAHLCATHLYDHQCDAHPAVCVAFCGFDFKGINEWDNESPECIVCEHMAAERGDWDLPDCHCSVCNEAGDA